MAETVTEFAARIKAKYPDYAEIPDKELVDRIVAKYPDYREMVTFDEPTETPETPTPVEEEEPENLQDTPPGFSEGLETGAGEALSSLAQTPAALADLAKRAGGVVTGNPQSVMELLNVLKNAPMAMGKELQSRAAPFTSLLPTVGKEPDTFGMGKSIGETGTEILTGKAIGKILKAGGRLAESIEKRSLVPLAPKSIRQWVKGPGADITVKPHLVRKFEHTLATLNEGQGVTGTFPDPKLGFNKMRDSSLPFIKRKLEGPVDTQGWRATTEVAANEFYDKHVGQWGEQLKNVPVDTTAMLEELTTAVNPLLDAAGHKTLNKFAQELKGKVSNVGYLEDLRRQINARQNAELLKKATVPASSLVRREIQLNAIRNAINSKYDELINQGVPMADVLRQYRDLRAVADHARDWALEVEQFKSTLSGKHFIFTPGIALSKPGMALQLARMVTRGGKFVLDPDRLMRRATSGILDNPKFNELPVIPIQPGKFKLSSPSDPGLGVRIGAPMTQEQAVAPPSLFDLLGQSPQGAQGSLPFVPPGAGSIGAALPEEAGFRPMQMPNALTREFAKPLGPAFAAEESGQFALPFAPSEVGGIPQRLGGFPVKKPRIRIRVNDKTGEITLIGLQGPTQLMQ